MKPNTKWLIATPRVFSLPVLLGVLVGCGADEVGSPDVALVAGPNEFGEHRVVRIDCGIIFFNERNYRCLSLDRLGIESVDKIRPIKTSCDCVHARTVVFRSAAKKPVGAIRLDFLADEVTGAEPLESRPVPLSVVVSILLSGGARVDLTVDFLHTVQLAIESEKDGDA